MARIKPGKTTRARHKKILKLAKGYRQSRSKIYRRASEATLHAGQYAYIGRKDKKRDFRRLWILRISQALLNEGVKYSDFINKMKIAKIEIDRKILAELINSDPATFSKIVQKVK